MVSGEKADRLSGRYRVPGRQEGLVTMGKQAVAKVVRVSVLLSVACLVGVVASAQTPPVNDTCDARIGLTCSQGTEAGTNIDATGTAAPFCGTTPGERVVWYSIMGNGDQITVDTCSPLTFFDTRLNVYRGSCDNEPGMTCVVGNDDAAGAPAECDLSGLNRKSRVSWASTGGVEYLVAVSGFRDASGDFELVIDCVIPVELQRLTVE